MKNSLAAILMATLLTPAIASAQLTETLIVAASKSPTKKPEMLQALVKGHVVIIASWTSGTSRSIKVQDFVRNGKSFVPIFSDQQHFKDETKGSGFESKGVSIDANMLASIIKGDETFVLNPGSKTPVDIHAKELKMLIDASRLPKQSS
jgi:SseB protein N-terminal domain